MIPEEPTRAPQPTSAPTSQPRSRPRRHRRPHRRPRGSGPPQISKQPNEAAPLSAAAGAELKPQPAAEPDQAPPSGQPISHAISEVNKVIEELKEVLNDLEKVQEILEIAEVQKETDEREIESLHRTLRALRNNRDRGQPQGPPNRHEQNTPA